MRQGYLGLRVEESPADDFFESYLGFLYLDLPLPLFVIHLYTYVEI